jgi:DNA-binding transcriptional MerR regulator
LGDLSRRYGVPVWKIRRLFTRGLVPEPERAGAYRVLRERDLARIEAALKKAGYLPAGGPDGAA